MAHTQANCINYNPFTGTSECQCTCLNGTTHNNIGNCISYWQDDDVYCGDMCHEFCGSPGGKWKRRRSRQLMKRGGRVNTTNNRGRSRSRWSGRTQNNPKGKPKK